MGSSGMMMMMMVMELCASQIIVAILLWPRLTCAAKPTRVPLWTIACPAHSITDSILGFRDYSGGNVRAIDYIGVTEVGN